MTEEIRLVPTAVLEGTDAALDIAVRRLTQLGIALDAWPGPAGAIRELTIAIALLNDARRAIGGDGTIPPAPTARGSRIVEAAFRDLGL